MTVSLCMIVKNEQSVLARCLDSVADLVDEIIIVDTGSTDATKDIAGSYTDRVYEFAWTGDFSEARNYAFSLATCDYIYTADADEVIDEVNRERFRKLLSSLLPEVEIVQMRYANQLDCGTVYNYDEELRPKLFKRLRPFVWISPVHETVRTDPVVYDSDVVITHMPINRHTARDLDIFIRTVRLGATLDTRLYECFARELLISGNDADYTRPEIYEYYEQEAQNARRTPLEVEEACLVLAKIAQVTGNLPALFRYTAKALSGEERHSEICFILGEYYEGLGDYAEAAIWYYNAAYECKPLLSLRMGGEAALKRFEHMEELLETV